MPPRIPRTLPSLHRMVTRVHPSRSIVRTFATPVDSPKIPAALHEKIKSAPRTLAQIDVIAKLFAEKGMAADREPSMTEMMKFMADKDIQGAMQALKSAMDEDGVTMDIMGLFNGIGKPK